jgi:putative holliday junction resolvase
MRDPMDLTALGFDYGTHRIGVAAGQTVTGTASPLGIIFVRRNKPDWSSVSALIQRWQPDALVVGLPVNMDGTEHELAPAIHRFTRQLRSYYGLPVHTIDERLSSREAQARLAGHHKCKEEVDAVAAQVILETWLSTLIIPQQRSTVLSL